MLNVISQPLCSKYLKDFPTESFRSKPDYSGYDFEYWPKRETLVHVQKIIATKYAITATARRTIERSYGSKYSVLNDLPAFDWGEPERAPPRAVNRLCCLYVYVCQERRTSFTMRMRV